MQSKQPVKGPSRCNVLRNSEGSRRQARGDFSEYSAYNIRASVSLRHAPVTLLWLAPECGGRSVSLRRVIRAMAGRSMPVRSLGAAGRCLNFHRLRPETLGMPVCQAARASEWCATSGRAATTFLRPFRGQRDALESASGHNRPSTGGARKSAKGPQPTYLNCYARRSAEKTLSRVDEHYQFFREVIASCFPV